MYWHTTSIGALPTEPAKYDPDHNRLSRLERLASSGNSWCILLDETPLRLLTSLDRATLGGKFTNSWTWLAPR